MAGIVFRPTCSKCQKILKNTVVDIQYYKESAIDYRMIHYVRDFQIEPEKCPYCGEYFEKIVMPNSDLPVKDSDLTGIV